MTRQAYPSDLSDEEWANIEPLIPGRKCKTPKREVLNAILYVLRTGSQWRYLPHDFPHWKNVYDYFQRWTYKDIFIKINDFLREELRLKDGRKAQPTAGCIDSQSVKTTETGRGKGFDGGEKDQRDQATYCS